MSALLDFPVKYTVNRNQGQTTMSEQPQPTGEPSYFKNYHWLLNTYGGKDKDNKGIGVFAIAVYNVLCHHANRQNQCWPSHNTIACMLDISRSTVQRAIEKLTQAGLITIEHRISQEAGHRTTTNIYTLVSQGTYPIVSETIAYSPTEHSLYSQGLQPIVSEKHKQEEEEQDKLELDIHEQEVVGEPTTSDLQIIEYPVKKTNKTKTKKAKTDNDQPAPFMDNPAVIIWRDIFHATPDLNQRKYLAEKVTDFTAWQEACTYWSLNPRWKKTTENIYKLVNCYEERSYDRAKRNNPAPGHRPASDQRARAGTRSAEAPGSREARGDAVAANGTNAPELSGWTQEQRAEYFEWEANNYFRLQNAGRTRADEVRANARAIISQGNHILPRYYAPATGPDTREPAGAGAAATAQR